MSCVHYTSLLSSLSSSPISQSPTASPATTNPSSTAKPPPWPPPHTAAVAQPVTAAPCRRSAPPPPPLFPPSPTTPRAQLQQPAAARHRRRQPRRRPATHDLPLFLLPLPCSPSQHTRHQSTSPADRLRHVAATACRQPSLLPPSHEFVWVLLHNGNLLWVGVKYISYGLSWRVEDAPILNTEAR